MLCLVPDRCRYQLRGLCLPVKRKARCGLPLVLFLCRCLVSSAPRPDRARYQLRRVPVHLVPAAALQLQRPPFRIAPGAALVHLVSAAPVVLVPDRLRLRPVPAAPPLIVPGTSCAASRIAPGTSCAGKEESPLPVHLVPAARLQLPPVRIAPGSAGVCPCICANSCRFCAVLPVSGFFTPRPL